MEIERKWLLNLGAIPWRVIKQNCQYEKTKIIQQYLELPDENVQNEVRIRKCESISGVKYYMTTKSYNENQGMLRKEQEKEISKKEFDSLYDDQKGNIVEKTRFSIRVEDLTYELDIYKKPNKLATVEVEFDSEEDANNFKKPCWFGEEVTHEPKYKNVNLAQKLLLDEKKIIEIVLTGGPCGGKSTILSELKRSFEEKGFKVLVSKEVATEIMESGSKPWEVISYVFQGVVVDSMLNNEKNMKLLAENYRQKGQDVIIFYDRGLADNRAYCDEETWKTVLEERDLGVENIHSMYNAVYNIETTAYGAEEIYMKQLGNNSTRYETTIEMAREAEDKTKKAWTGHHNFLIFRNTSSGWNGKQSSIFDETYRLLGMSPVIRHDERYLVDIPIDMKEFELTNNSTKQRIEQIYLKKFKGFERRIRKVGDGDGAAYYYTEKEGQGKDRVVRDKIISQEVYQSLSIQADENRKPIKKVRYSFIQGQEYFVMDVFPENEYLNLPEGKAIIESKGTTEKDSKPSVPKGFLGVENITNNPQYSNAILALKEKII